MDEWRPVCLKTNQRLPEPDKGDDMMKLYLNFELVIAVLLAASIARADSLELKNGSLIKGKFTGGTESEISMLVGSSVQKYNLTDIVSLRFDSERPPDMPTRPTRSFPERPEAEASAKTVRYITIPAGTRISVRTIDRIDSIENHVGDRFQASLEEPLTVDGNVVVAKGADVYGRLAESKESGKFTGRSQLPRGEHGEENDRRSSGGFDHRRPRWRRQRSRDRRRRRWRSWRRVGNHHQGGPGKNTERDPARFHSAAGFVDTTRVIDPLFPHPGGFGGQFPQNLSCTQEAC